MKSGLTSRILVRAVILLLLALLLPLLVGLAGAGLLYTQAGTRAALGMASDRIEGLSIQRISGRLGAGLTLHGVKYVADGLLVTLSRAHILWRPGALLESAVELPGLTLESLVIEVDESAPAEEPATAFTLPSSLGLPVSVRLADASVTQFALTVSGTTVAVDVLELEALLRAGDEQAQHSAQLQWKGLRVNAEARAQTEQPTLQSAAGVWQVRGSLVDYQTTFEAQQQVLSAPAGELLVEGRGDGNSLTLGSIKANVQEGSAIGDARVSWAPRFAIATTFTGNLGDSQFDVTGQVGDRLDAQWRIDSPDLSTFYPELEGSLRSTGELGGTASVPKVKAELAIADLRFGPVSVESLTADIDLDLTASGEAALAPSTLRASNVRYAQWSISSAEGDLLGSQEQHTLRLDAKGEQIALQASLQGGLANQRWRGALLSASLRPPDLGAWTLEGTQALDVSATEQALGHGCWRSASARLCVSGRQDDVTGEGAVTLAALPLDYFSTLLPEALFVEGLLSADAKLTRPAGQAWSLEAKVLTSAGRIGERPGEDDSAQSVALAPGRFHLQGGLARLDAVVDLPFAEQGGVKGELTLSELERGTQAAVGGTVDISIPRLGFLAASSPEIESISGAAQLRLAMAGTLEAPQPTGELSIRASDVALVGPGLLLDKLTVDGQAGSSGEISLRAAINAQDSELNLQGIAQLAMPGESRQSPLESFQAQLTGDTFPFWQTEEASVWGSPDLSLTLREDTLQLNGRVHVPRARIAPTQLPPSAVRVSPDQVIVVDESYETVGNRDSIVERFSADIVVSLGEEVAVEGFGFRGRLGGELAIKQKPGKPVLASGELNVIDGEYRAFGQGLVIERGQLLFAGGSIDNPGLNIRAQRRPDANVVVGVNVGGPLQQPSVEVFSEPLMSSSNQLSWLVLGRPFESTDGAEADYITQAALILGIRGGDYLAKGIGQKLGVDTIGIETGSGEAGGASDVNQAALVVGKYLTPRLYVSYGVGLLESISTVRLRYKISDRWNVETESSPIASGGDLNFSIER